MSHLRLVPDPDQPKPIEPKKPRRKPGPKPLEPEQTARLAALLRNLRRIYCSWKCVAELLDYSALNLRMICWGRPGYRGSSGLAARAAELAGIPVRQILKGGLHDTAKCSECNRPSPDE
jgi:hypothetical protein